MTNYPALGFDPAPGEPAAVTNLANNFATVAQHLGTARDALNQIGHSDGIWQGQAADNFRGKVGSLPDYLGKANGSLGDAAKALDGWATDLTSMKQQAADYETKAEQALQRLQQAQANPNLGLAGQTFNTQQALQQAQTELNAAEQQLNSAQQELNAIREDSRRLLSQHDDLAHRVADALRRAKDEAPPEPGFWDSLGNALSNLLGGIKSLAGKVWQWTKNHAGDIAKIGDILSKVSAVLGVIALATAPFEPVGAIFGAAAGITSVAALATQGLAKAAGANVSWTSIGLDAVGAIPFVGAVAKGAKVAQAGLDTAGAVGRAGELSNSLGDGVSVARSAVHAADGGVTKLVGDGLGSKLLVGGESKIMNGQFIGTGGFNKLVTGLDKIPALSGIGARAVDPLSNLGRGIDLGLGTAKSAGSITYDALHGSGGNPPQPAGPTFSSRVAARAGS